MIFRKLPGGKIKRSGNRFGGDSGNPNFDRRNYSRMVSRGWRLRDESFRLDCREEERSREDVTVLPVDICPLEGEPKPFNGKTRILRDRALVTLTYREGRVVGAFCQGGAVLDFRRFF